MMYNYSIKGDEKMYSLKKFKAALALVLMMVLLTASIGFPVAAAQETISSVLDEESGLIFGDSNGDGAVDSIDYSLLRNYVNGTLEIFPYKDAVYSMDVDADGDIDSQDALAVKDFILQRRYSFPADILVASMPQKVFRYNYTNYAWGTVIEDLSIDNQGNVTASGAITEASDDNPPITKIPKIELQEKYLDLLKASSGTITPKTFQWFDAGDCTYSGYISDGTTKEVLLKLDGDFTQDNLSPYAAPILDWFKGIISGYFYVPRF
jgi:hypothetical protein